MVTVILAISFFFVALAQWLLSMLLRRLKRPTWIKGRRVVPLNIAVFSLCLLLAAYFTHISMARDVEAEGSARPGSAAPQSPSAPMMQTPVPTAVPKRSLKSWAREVGAACRQTWTPDLVETSEKLDDQEIASSSTATTFRKLSDAYARLTSRIQDIEPPSRRRPAVDEYIQLFAERGERLHIIAEDLSDGDTLSARWHSLGYSSLDEDIRAKAAQLGINTDLCW